MPLKLSAALLTLAAANFDPLVQFYCQLLSQQPNRYIPNVYAEFQLPGLTLGIFRPKQPEQYEPTASCRSAMSLCLEVENLEAAIAHLYELGYSPPGPIVIASHGREIDAFDPNRNRLILHESW
jgi:hypothetical protein